MCICCRTASFTFFFQQWGTIMKEKKKCDMYTSATCRKVFLVSIKTCNPLDATTKNAPFVHIYLLNLQYSYQPLSVVLRGFTYRHNKTLSPDGPFNSCSEVFDQATWSGHPHCPFLQSTLRSISYRLAAVRQSELDESTERWLPPVSAGCLATLCKDQPVGSHCAHLRKPTHNLHFGFRTDYTNSI